MSQVSLIRSEVEKDGMLLGEAPDSDGKEYAKGLQMTLEKPELDKLGLQELAVGKSYNVTGVMKVTGIEETPTGSSVTVQMVSLGAEGGEGDRTATMYGG